MTRGWSFQNIKGTKFKMQRKCKDCGNPLPKEMNKNRYYCYRCRKKTKMVIKSEEIEGKITHWVDPEHKEYALKGEFVIHKHREHLKPTGLWLSWNNGWEEWCKSEKPGWIENRVCLKAKLEPGLNIWHIDSLKDFDHYWNIFLKGAEKQGTYKDMEKKLGKEHLRRGISAVLFIKKNGMNFWEWLEKRKKIDGIALTDKGQWKTRMTTFFYGWDCATIFIFKPKGKVKLYD